METEKIKATDLMIGDWVSLGDNCQNAVVIGIAINRVIVASEDGNVLQNSCIYPITLTAEMLVANGFKPIFDIQEDWYILHTDYVDEFNNSYTVIAKIGGDGWCDIDIYLNYEEDDNPQYVLPDVSYVHELQNLLRACKLKKLADNFKVE